MHTIKLLKLLKKRRVNEGLFVLNNNGKVV
jgi:hypothetical protein